MTERRHAPEGTGSFAAEARDPAEWGGMVAASLLALDMETDRPGDFTARMRNRTRAGIHLAEIEASGHEARRGPEKVVGDAGALVLCHVRAGEGVVIQDGRQAMLTPGDFAFYDTTRPVQIVVPDGFRILFLKFPQPLAAVSRGALRDLVAERIPRRSGLGPAVGALLAELNEAVDTLPAEVQGRSLRSAVDLAATMIRHELLGAAGADALGRKRRQFEKIAAYIEENLAEPELSPARIAAENFVSLRQLHAVFADSGATVGSWIRRRRLERSARDLADPRMATVPVGVICLRNGFRNQPYFSQIFKEWSGQSPAEYRAQALA
jgi:AraC-like DNA-binding protein